MTKVLVALGISAKDCDLAKKLEIDEPNLVKTVFQIMWVPNP